MQIDALICFNVVNQLEKHTVIHVVSSIHEIIIIRICHFYVALARGQSHLSIECLCTIRACSRQMPKLDLCVNKL